MKHITHRVGYRQDMSIAQQEDTEEDKFSPTF